MSEDRQACFSHHAFKRLAQRTRCTAQDLVRLIDLGLSVNLGSPPGIHKEHLLFYSPVDETCFVAIRSTLCGTFVTILPLDYHARLAWPVSQEHCERAKALWEARPPAPIELPPRDPPTRIRMSCGARMPDGKFRTKTILNVEAARYGGDLSAFLADEEVFGRIRELIAAAGFVPELAQWLTVSFGKSSKPLVIDIPWRYDYIAWGPDPSSKAPAGP